MRDAFGDLLPAEIWVDLETAHRSLDRAEGALRHGRDVDAARDATVASSILRRGFLTGIDNRRHVIDGHGDSTCSTVCVIVSDGEVVGEIGKGLLVLLGVEQGDEAAQELSPIEGRLVHIIWHRMLPGDRKAVLPEQ